jgi:hypothetical protein
VRTKERGAALVLVVVALAVLLPIALVLWRNVFAWQGQATAFKEAVRRESVLRNAVERAAERLRTRDLALAVDEARHITLPEITEPLTVEITRQPDAVVTLDGDVLRGAETRGVNLGQFGVDNRGAVVYQYRKLEIYLVEAESRGASVVPSVRVLGVLGRDPDGRVMALGVRADRGYY